MRSTAKPGGTSAPATESFPPLAAHCRPWRGNTPQYGHGNTMATMTSRERVKRALNHQEVDRIPVDFGGTVVTCLDYHAHRRLKKFFGLDDGDDPIIDHSMGTVAPDERLMRRFGSDFRRVAMNVIPPRIEGGVFENGFGNKLKRADPHLYYDTIYFPLRDADVSQLDTMLTPDPDNPSLYEGLGERAKALYEGTDYAIVADFGVPGFYETSQKLRGYENLACDLLTDTEFVRALYDRLLELQKRFFKNYLGQVGKYVQVIGYADDLGMQDRPQISPALYREVVMPYHRAIFKYIHELADVKILLHSCGAIRPMIDSLVEAGVDILNPLQTRARGMVPVELRAEFGGKVCFWGGVDEQEVLPRGTVDEVKREVARLKRDMGPTGFVLGPSHNFQADTPPANIEALYQAAFE